MTFRTIFDVDIEGFEEKPWKYPGVDISDFFNFGLNEETWKDYCKQLVKYFIFVFKKFHEKGRLRPLPPMVDFPGTTTPGVYNAKQNPGI